MNNRKSVINMKDIYKEMMFRSYKDTIKMCEDIEQEFGVTIPPEAFGPMALQLYRHRIQSWRERIRASGNSVPDGTPNIGRM